jgi:hypothetical protein
MEDRKPYFCPHPPLRWSKSQMYFRNGVNFILYKKGGLSQNNNLTQCIIVFYYCATLLDLSRLVCVCCKQECSAIIIRTEEDYNKLWSKSSCVLIIFVNWLSLFMLFMSTGWDCVSELHPLSGLLLIPQMLYDHGQWRWTDVEDRRTRRRPIAVPLCPTQNPHGLTGANRGLRGERPATNSLSPGTAFLGCQGDVKSQVTDDI